MTAQPAPVAGTNNTFILGNFTANQSVLVNITVLVLNVSNGTVINNTANTSYQNSNGTKFNLSVTEGTTVLNPPVFNFSNISVSKADSPDPVSPNTQLNYTITVTSTGNGTAFNVTVNDTYPPQVVFVSAQPTPLAGTNNTFILGNLTNGTTIVINITVNVAPSLADGLVINNSVNVTFQNETSAELSVTDTESTTITNPPPTSSGGSGGGGGGVSYGRTFSMTGDSQSFNLRRTHRVSFKHKALLHYITILNIYSDRVHLRVQSTPQEFTIAKGASQVVDVDKDGTNDIRLTVTDIKYYEATLRVELLGAACVESWTCEAWSDCIGGQQTRECRDLKSCGTTKLKPVTTQACEAAPAPAPAAETQPPAVPAPAAEAAPSERAPVAIPPKPGFWNLTKTFYVLVALALVILIAYWYVQTRKKR